MLLTFHNEIILAIPTGLYQTLSPPNNPLLVGGGYPFVAVYINLFFNCCNVLKIFRIHKLINCTLIVLQEPHVAKDSSDIPMKNMFDSFAFIITAVCHCCMNLFFVLFLTVSHIVTLLSTMITYHIFNIFPSLCALFFLGKCNSSLSIISFCLLPFLLIPGGLTVGI